MLHSYNCISSVNSFPMRSFEVTLDTPLSFPRIAMRSIFGCNLALLCELCVVCLLLDACAWYSSVYLCVWQKKKQGDSESAALPHSSIDDLHDTLVDALAHIDEWCATFPHFPQQQTWEQITQSHSCLLIVVVQPSYPDKEKKTLQNVTNCIVVSWLVI